MGRCSAYRRGWLRADLLAGLAVWAILVPESLAYAVLAGVPPAVGLWATPAALLLYAALGSSRHLVVGPMSATSALSGVVVAGLASGHAGGASALTAGLALVTGLILVGAGLLRLGFLAGFVSQPVLKGFIIGLALTIVAGQVPKLLGLERVDGAFVEKVWGLSTELGHTKAWTVAVGAGSLVLLLVLRRFARLLPAAMVVVLAGVLASVLLDLPEHGVAVVGPIASGLPPFGLPGCASRTTPRSSPVRSASPSSGSPRASLRRRHTQPKRATTSNPTVSCSASGRRTWGRACAPGWWWPAACPRLPPTAARARARRYPGWSSPF